MTFDEVKSGNGTPLKSYGELLIEKAKDLGFTVVIAYASQELKMLHTQSSIAGSPAKALMSMALAMYGLDASQQRAVMEAVENEFGDAQIVAAPTISSKPN
jgi:hypothetical protein